MIREAKINYENNFKFSISKVPTSATIFNSQNLSGKIVECNDLGQGQNCIKALKKSERIKVIVIHTLALI